MTASSGADRPEEPVLPPTAKRGVARLLGYVLAFAAIALGWDALLFRSGLYYRWLTPESAAGSTRSAMRVADNARLSGKRNVLLLGNSQMGEGFSALIADEAVPGTDLHFVNGAIPGSDPRVWYYLLRRIDPHADRFAALVMAVPYEEGIRTYAQADYAIDISFLTPLLRLTDIVDFPSSFDDAALAQRARRAILFPAQPLHEDIMALLAAPAERIKRLRVWRKSYVGSFLHYAGHADAIPDLVLDPQTLQPRDWLDLRPELKPELANYLAGLAAHRSASDEVRASNRRYDQKWLTRIIAPYRARGIPIVLIEVPRGPFHGAHAPMPVAAGVAAELAAAGLVSLLPGDSFVDLEQPRYFFDTLHMNRAGRGQFSPRLARLLAAVLH